MNSELIAFVADSLDLWRVEGEVAAGAAPIVAVVRARGRVIAIERNTENDAPWRWFVRWREEGAADERSRPCASLTGMLNALRRALGVERGSALRVAPAPSAKSPRLQAEKG